MNEGIITTRYAKALYQASDEIDKTDLVKKDIDAIYLVIRESKEFVEFLNSPIIRSSEKKKIIKELFSGGVEDITLSFLQMLMHNKRENYLPSICLNYIQQYKKKRNIREAVISTAQLLSEIHKGEIQKFINKKFKIDVDLTNIVEESLIGGFKLRIDDKQIDATIASKLKKIRTELINS